MLPTVLTSPLPGCLGPRPSQDRALWFPLWAPGEVPWPSSTSLFAELLRSVSIVYKQSSLANPATLGTMQSLSLIQGP